MSDSQKKLLFALRSKMVNFRNLLNNDLKCQTFDDKTSIEDENHVINCENLKTEESKCNDENPMLEQCQSLRQPCFYLSFVKLLRLALI